jgi:hypothetical protein
MPEPWEVHKTQLERLETLGYNLDLERTAEYTRSNGWNVDEYEAELPPESPGEPLPGGSFEAAKAVMREYRFPPPDLITGVFVPDQPLEKRVMLLRGRFLGFTFWFGVRVRGVTDEVRDREGSREQVWGYRYATLEGHFERGEIEFLVAKNLGTGAVAFRIHAFSRTGIIRNPLYWLGFRLFGRGLQKRFANESMRRMQKLVKETLLRGRGPGAGEANSTRTAL